MRWLLLAFVAIASLSAGCRSLEIEDGKLPCSKAGTCPAPYVCSTGNNKCYRHLPAIEGGVTDSNDASSGDTSDTRDAADAGGGGGDGGEAGTTKSPNGHGCVLDGDCTSGSCRDGVCCNDACAGACRACANTYTGMADGVCANAIVGSNPRNMCVNETATAPCGLDGTCDGSGQCGKVPANRPCGQPTCSADGHMFIPAGACNGTGTCAPGTSQDCGAFACASTGCAKPCTGAADCPTTQYCSSNGTCKIKKAPGVGCSAAAECDTGFCSSDLVCCDKVCAGLCTSCLKSNTGLTDGICGSSQLGLDPHNDCSPDDVTTCAKDGACDGKGACHLFASGTGCGPGSCSGQTFTPSKICNGTGTCAPSGTNVDCGVSACSTDGCKTTCTVDGDCATTSYCNTTSRQCAAKKSNGGACTLAKECTSAACVEGVCCNTACAGRCLSCLGTRTGGADGTCSYSKAGTDPDNECDMMDPSTCAQDGTCDGAGQCAKWSNSTVCAAGMCSAAGYTSQRICSAGACPPALPVNCGAAVCDAASGCRTTCTGNADCVGSNYCDTGTMRCAPQKAAGATCAGNTQCLSGYCVDGVCCNTACNGACSSCLAAQTGLAANGTCGFVTNGTDPGNECASDGVACGRDGFCSGSGACRYTPSGTNCANATCTGSTYRPPSKCDGAGTCMQQSQVSCSPYVCNGSTACNTTCTADSACVTTAYCGSSSCMPKKALGSTCGGNNQCTNGMCSVDGICCGTPCTASCQACTMASTGVATGTCAPQKSTAQLVSSCAGACPIGYAMCTAAGQSIGCGRTRWDMEGGAPVFYNSMEWNPGEAGIDYVMSRAHTGSWSDVIRSDSQNYNAFPNMYPCDVNNGASMDLRGKTFTVWMLADGPVVTGAFVALFAQGDGGDNFQMQAPIPVTTFGQWFSVSMTLNNASSTINNIGYQLFFGVWSGSFYFDDVSIQ